MGKRTRIEGKGAVGSTAPDKPAVAVTEAAAVRIDPALDALFQSSLTSPAVSFKRQYKDDVESKAANQANESRSSDELGSAEDLEDIEDDDAASDSMSDTSSAGNDDADGATLSHSYAPYSKNATQPSQNRKRKREEDDLEGRYLQRLAVEHQREESSRHEAAGLNNEHESPSASEHPNNDFDAKEGNDDDADNEKFDPANIPQHETLAKDSKDVEIEKATRTVFLSNVASAAISSKPARRTLIQHLSSFIPDLPNHKPPHKVESLRFRSTAFATTSIPRRAAYAKKEVMDATTKSTNAYAVYSTTLAAREATKRLNASVVLDRHLRVDSVAHPAPVDHRRCVFVGNLGFVDDESMVRASNDKKDERPHKQKYPGDVEEGLWRQFGHAGTVESVRVVRDPQTRVGKGFAYVQFKDENAVERALAFNDKKYPPMLLRPLRVTRARKLSSKNPRNKADTNPTIPSKGNVYNAKRTAEDQSLAGRAPKLLGRGGAARWAEDGGASKGKRFKSADGVVLEGHRARNDQAQQVPSRGRKARGAANTTMNRSRRRAAAYRSAKRSTTSH